MTKIIKTPHDRFFGASLDVSNGNAPGGGMTAAVPVAVVAGRPASG